MTDQGQTFGRAWCFALIELKLPIFFTQRVSNYLYYSGSALSRIPTKVTSSEPVDSLRYGCLDVHIVGMGFRVRGS